MDSLLELTFALILSIADSENLKIFSLSFVPVVVPFC